MSFQDKSLHCADCGQDFEFTAGEQEFYASRGLQNEPRRCPECRRAKKSQRSSGNDFRAPRQMFPAVCAECGCETEVPFEPREERPVYCNDCFNKSRMSR
ncbi:MAG: zinc-ribbon domain containing protein [Dehalococcoidia bacterium]